MEERRLALMVFYDEKGRVLLQDRRDMSKYGEEWGYFGGGIDGEESPEDAIKREILEELEFEIDVPEHLGKYVGHGRTLKDPTKEVKAVMEVFCMKVGLADCRRMVVHEGAGKRWFSIATAKRQKMPILDPHILDDIGERIRKK
jgi:8-oxo-dGTP pyrophosphatase MutT (NUDIX family)